MNQYWIVIVERLSDGNRKRSEEYGADASGFSHEGLLAETEDNLRKLMSCNIATFDTPDGDFHAKAGFLTQKDPNRLIQGIIRKVVSMHHKSDGWAAFDVTSRREPVPNEDVVWEEYGIKVWRLRKPLAVD